MRKSRNTGPMATAAKAAAVAAGSGLAAAAGWTAYSALAIDHRHPLPPAVNAERRQFRSFDAGILSYYASDAARGRPLLLVHSVNAAASAYEMRPLFERYRGERPVYALDLPGFGFSERSDRVYSPELYSAAILDLVRQELPAAEPFDVVALSLGCEFSASAVLAQPDRFRSLAMISPTGFSSNQKIQQGSGRWRQAWLSFPLWSQAFYDLLVTPPSIRYFLQKSFHRNVDATLAAYDYASAHQPGARYAPLYFVSGKLFTPDVRNDVYARLPLPVLVLYNRSGYGTLDELPGFAGSRANWTAIRIAGSKELPQFENPAETAGALDHFWQSLDEMSRGSKEVQSTA
jgi:pimeloyl-ACP methyl ester carboxylesterase